MVTTHWFWLTRLSDMWAVCHNWIASAGQYHESIIKIDDDWFRLIDDDVNAAADCDDHSLDGFSDPYSGLLQRCDRLSEGGPDPMMPGNAGYYQLVMGVLIRFTISGYHSNYFGMKSHAMDESLMKNHHPMQFRRRHTAVLSTNVVIQIPLPGSRSMSRPGRSLSSSSLLGRSPGLWFWVMLIYFLGYCMSTWSP